MTCVLMVNLQSPLNKAQLALLCGLVLLADHVCLSKATPLGKPDPAQPSAPYWWATPAGGGLQPAAALSQPGAAPSQFPPSSWRSPEAAPADPALAPGQQSQTSRHAWAEDTLFVQGMLPLDNNGYTVRPYVVTNFQLTLPCFVRRDK